MKDNTRKSHPKTVLMQLAAHRVFNQLFNFTNNKTQSGQLKTSAYDFLTELNSEFPVGNDGKVHFSLMDDAKCRLAISKLIAISSNISRFEADKISNKYFDYVLELGFVTPDDPNIPSLPNKNIQQLNKELLFRKNSAVKTKKEDVLVNLQDESEDEKFVKSIFIDLFNDLKFEQLIPQKYSELLDIKKVVDEQRSRLEIEDERLICKLSEEERNLSENKDQKLQNLFASEAVKILKINFGERFDDFIIDFQNQNNQLIQNQKKMEAEEESVAPEISQLKKFSPIDGQSNKKKKKPKNLNPKSTQGTSQVAEAELPQEKITFQGCFSELKKLPGINAKDRAQAYFEVKRKIDILITNNSNDQNLFFLFSEMVKFVTPRKSGEARITYFDDLVDKFSALLRKKKISIPQTAQFNSFKKNHLKSNITQDKYLDELFCNFFRSEFDYDKLIFPLLENINLRPESLDLSKLASYNPNNALRILKFLGKKISPDERIKFATQSCEVVLKFMHGDNSSQADLKEAVKFVTAQDLSGVDEKLRKDLLFSIFESGIDYPIENIQKMFPDKSLKGISSMTNKGGVNFLTVITFFGKMSLIEKMVKECGSDEFIEFLVHKDESGFSPLMIMAHYGKIDGARKLLDVIPEKQRFDYIVNNKTQQYQQNALFIASALGYLDIVNAILNVIPEDKKAPLIEKKDFNDETILTIFLKRIAQITKEFEDDSLKQTEDIGSRELKYVDGLLNLLDYVTTEHILSFCKQDGRNPVVELVLHIKKLDILEKLFTKVPRSHESLKMYAGFIKEVEDGFKGKTPDPKPELGSVKSMANNTANTNLQKL
ncbi:MAG: hypothetical protein ACJAW3_001086 [Lentimonas sp.]|jgi:hypothetical protein